jgi:hypothetical protein
MSNTILQLPACTLLLIALSIPLAAAEPSSTSFMPKLLLQVSARSEVPTSSLRRAEQEVIAVFKRIGVDVDWIGCGLDSRADDGRARRPPLPIRVAVMAHMSKAFIVIPSDVLGLVMRESDAQETAWVLFDRIERVSDRYALDTGLVLGHAMAHEIAHLLLPRGRHGANGLMRPSWDSDNLLDAVHGQLGFSAGEADLIRARLAR